LEGAFYGDMLKDQITGRNLDKVGLRKNYDSPMSPSDIESVGDSSV